MAGQRRIAVSDGGAVLTAENQYENEKLLAEIKKGSSEALDTLVKRNMGMVKKIALRFVGRGVEQEDLVQIGVIGMIKAARCFDLELGTSFSTYAFPLIMGEIRRFLRDDGPIKVSRSQKQKAALVQKACAELAQKNGRNAHISEIVEQTGLSNEDVVSCFEVASGVISLDESIGGDDSGITLKDSISDDGFGLDHLTDRIALGEAVRGLPPMWRKIVYLRYFKELSQSEVGKRLGISQVKVSREEQKILQNLRLALG